MIDTTTTRKVANQDRLLKVLGADIVSTSYVLVERHFLTFFALMELGRRVAVEIHIVDTVGFVIVRRTDDLFNECDPDADFVVGFIGIASNTFHHVHGSVLAQKFEDDVDAKAITIVTVVPGREKTWNHGKV